MDLLKRDMWWVWLLFIILGSGFVQSLILAIFLKNLDKDQWYAKWWVWTLGIIFFFIPAMIMFIVFSIQLQVNNALKLDVPGKELYYNPYFWILGIIIPIIGWIAISFMGLYLIIMTLVQLYNGYGEKYIIKT